MTEPDEILVVDDDSLVLKLLTDILSAEGCSVRSANNGELALTLIAAKPPQLILLDIDMPEMDGFEVCWRLKWKKLATYPYQVIPHRKKFPCSSILNPE
ncbi:MAG: response regulator [Thermodesulfobacteriota bacterium]